MQKKFETIVRACGIYASIWANHIIPDRQLHLFETAEHRKQQADKLCEALTSLLVKQAFDMWRHGLQLSLTLEIAYNIMPHPIIKEAMLRCGYEEGSIKVMCSAARGVTHFQEDGAFECFRISGRLGKNQDWIHKQITWHTYEEQLELALRMIGYQIDELAETMRATSEANSLSRCLAIENDFHNMKVRQSEHRHPSGHGFVRRHWHPEISFLSADAWEEWFNSSSLKGKATRMDAEVITGSGSMRVTETSCLPF